MLRPTVLASAAILLIALAAVTTYAQWGPGGCATPSWQLPAMPVFQPVFQTPSYAWKANSSEPDRIYLHRNGSPWLCWDYPAAAWTQWDDARRDWLSWQYTKPPFEPPPRTTAVTQNHGLDWSKISPMPKVTLHEKGGSRALRPREALDLLQSLPHVGKPDPSEIPDDSKKFRLTVIGSDDQRKAVVTAWQSLSDADLKSRVIVRAVAPGDWSLKDFGGGPGFVQEGNPAICFQAPDGKVLHRQSDFAGVSDFEAIRKGAKKYDASKDPDLRKPDILPANFDESGLALLLLLAGGAALIYINKRS